MRERHLNLREATSVNDPNRTETLRARFGFESRPVAWGLRAHEDKLAEFPLDETHLPTLKMDTKNKEEQINERWRQKTKQKNNTTASSGIVASIPQTASENVVSTLASIPSAKTW